jgi:hypothetical protein
MDIAELDAIGGKKKPAIINMLVVEQWFSLFKKEEKRLTKRDSDFLCLSRPIALVECRMCTHEYLST